MAVLRRDPGIWLSEDQITSYQIHGNEVFKVYVRISLQILAPKCQWGHHVIEASSLHTPHRVILGPSLA